LLRFGEVAKKETNNFHFVFIYYLFIHTYLFTLSKCGPLAAMICRSGILLFKNQRAL